MIISRLNTWIEIISFANIVRFSFKLGMTLLFFVAPESQEWRLVQKSDERFDLLDFAG
jgi:hypothetical protein